MKKITLLLITLLMLTCFSSATSYNLKKTINGVGVITTIPEGSSVTLTYMPDTAFSRWKVISGTLSLSNPTNKSVTFTMPAQDIEIEAITHTHSYSEATCTVPPTCSCGETNGDALGHTWVEATCTVAKTCSTCRATEGSALGHNYTGTRTCNVNGSKDTVQCTRCSETENQDCTHTYTISKGTEINGTITLSATTVKAGGSVTATITPASGYSISGITVNGTTVTVSNKAGMTHTISNITENKTVNVTFTANNVAPNTPTISVASKTTTTITFNISGSDPDGDSLTYDVYVGGSKNGSTTTTSYTTTTLTHATQYTYYVIAKDPSGATATSTSGSTYTKCAGTGKTCTTSSCDGKCDTCGGKGSYLSGAEWCATCGGDGTLEGHTCTSLVECANYCPVCESYITSTSCYTCLYSYMKCPFCEYTYTGLKGGCGICGGLGYICEHQDWTCEEQHLVDCSSCTSGKCTHGQSSSHRYCTHYPTTTTKTSHAYCSHGNTGEHFID